MDDVPAIVSRYYELLDTGDIERLGMLYTPDAEIVRYDGVAKTRSGIADYFRDYLAGRPRLRLRAIDQIRHEGDVVMWDALLDSDLGILQTVDVAILDDDGLIWRHIPGFRGFWGD